MARAHTLAARTVAVAVMARAHTLAPRTVAVAVMDVHIATLTDFMEIHSRRIGMKQPRRSLSAIHWLCGSGLKVELDVKESRQDSCRVQPETSERFVRWRS